MLYRHEVKHLISQADAIAICARMDAIGHRDSHVNSDGNTFIRSLYFDNPYDKALIEKQDGISVRDKYRIRYYDGNTSFIKLERKSKVDGLCAKVFTDISAEEVQRILNGDLDWMPGSGRALIAELYVKMRTELLRPRSIVDYTRTPFVYEPGNVRVTLDYDIRSGLHSTDFLNPDSVTVPSAPGVTVLEVKWDEYLPGIIKQAVQLKGARAGSFSKYEAARIYG